MPSELALLAPSLKKLWLDDNRLQALPAAVLELGGLTALRLSRNQLTTLPAQVSSGRIMSSGPCGVCPAARCVNSEPLPPWGFSVRLCVCTQIRMLSNLEDLAVDNNQLK